jgi:hypothetical protein
MAIEVKQLIIKSTLVSNHRQSDRVELATEDLEALKQEVIEECRELVEQSLEALQER